MILLLTTQMKVLIFFKFIHWYGLDDQYKDPITFCLTNTVHNLLETKQKINNFLYQYHIF